MLKFSLVFFALFSCYYCSQLYTVEYQFQIYDSEFDGGRDAGVDFYFSSWSNVAGVNYQTFNQTETYRSTAIVTLSDCGSGDILRKRDYIYGDISGTTVGLKSAGSLTESQALNENFSPAPEYENSSDYFIEYDVHPCESDWAANCRIYLTSSPDISTCSDVYAFFPDAVDNSNVIIQANTEGSVEYAIYRSGAYLDGSIDLVITITYPSLQDAIDDTNGNVGEFSYTFFGTPEISSDSMNELDYIEEQLLSVIGSSGDYPCDSNSNQSSNQSTANESSGASIISISFAILVLCAILF